MSLRVTAERHWTRVDRCRRRDARAASPPGSRPRAAAASRRFAELGFPTRTRRSVEVHEACADREGGASAAGRRRRRRCARARSTRSDSASPGGPRLVFVNGRFCAGPLSLDGLAGMRRDAGESRAVLGTSDAGRVAAILGSRRSLRRSARSRALNARVRRRRRLRARSPADRRWRRAASTSSSCRYRRRRPRWRRTRASLVVAGRAASATLVEHLRRRPATALSHQRGHRDRAGRGRAARALQACSAEGDAAFHVVAARAARARQRAARRHG